MARSKSTFKAMLDPLLQVTSFSVLSTMSTNLDTPLTKLVSHFLGSHLSYLELTLYSVGKPLKVPLLIPFSRTSLVERHRLAGSPTST